MSSAGDIGNDDLLTMTTLTTFWPWLMTANEATMKEFGSDVASSLARLHTEGMVQTLHRGRRMRSYRETV